ncbi:50S ribosomal protein L18 [Afifella pfennigii]|uniref:50S ribosomal protein L18 n=1 Tax=Afifella pfennigii TaxID=209897 RepID=UPI000551DBEE|nr:50S ribosomal protein L18 [Afifella pfennigii]
MGISNTRQRMRGERRKGRVRAALKRVAFGRPRLSVFRSSQHIYAQIIDDQRGHTVAAASTLEKELREKLKTGANRDAASEVGRLVAERAKAAGIEKVQFDRGSYIYHGRIRALADAAREAGLEF